MNSRSYHDWEDLILKEDKEKIQKNMKWKRVMKQNKLTERKKEKKMNKIKQNMYKRWTLNYV